MRSGGFFDYDTKRERLEEVERELEHPDVWNDAARAQALGRERSLLDKTVNGIRNLKEGLTGASELLELAEMEDDEDTALAVVTDAGQAAIEAAAPDHVASVRHLFIDLLTPEELRMISAVSQKVLGRLHDPADPTGS